MKKRIYRYIAIAFGVLALFVAFVEINVSGIPFFAFICALAAKQFYDSSVGKVTSGSYNYRPEFNPNTEIQSPWRHDTDYNSSSSSLARGEHPYGGAYVNYD